MKTIKPGKISLLTRVFEREGEHFFVLSPLLHFAFSPVRRLLSEQEMWKFVPAELGPQLLDVGMPKVRGEVLVCGKACPPQPPRPVCSVRVKIASVDKKLTVVGDRVWRHGVPTDPEPFAEMPLDYTKAFGGEGYPQNPLGKGFAPGPDKVQALPNIEHAGRLIRSPKEHPAPACFAPYDIAWPQRHAKAGTHDKKWLKTRFPGFAADMDWTIFNAAPDDQQVQGYFTGDETFVLEGMHPGATVLEGRLPGVRTRAFITQRDRPGLHEVATRLDTVWFFPHAERGVLVFRGLTRVAEDDAADVQQLVLACEALGEPRPDDHYARVLAIRLDKKKGAIASLRDRDLMPPNDPPEPREPSRVPGAVLRKRLRKRLEAEHGKLVAKMSALGADTSQVPPLPPAPDETPPDIDDLGEFVEEKQATAERMKAEAQAEQKKAEEKARADLAKQGLDYDELVEEEKAKSGGPPKFSAEDQMETLRGLATMASNTGMEIPQVTAALADPAIEAKLKEAEAKLRESYRKFAHLSPPARRLEGEEAARVRAEVARAAAARESMAGRDFTGADLSGMNLARADLRGAFLERANLEGTELGGADLSGAVLARADLTRANLFAAKLVDTNLGAATLVEAELGEADLTKAVLASADLTRARLRRVRIDGADLLEAKVRESDWSGATGPKTKLIKLDLGGAKFVGADLSRSIFLECMLDGTDFTEAKLSDGSFIGARGRGTCFRGADLEKVSFAGESSLQGAVFAGAAMNGANLRGVDLTGADFERARLAGADLSESKLHGANLHAAYAREARLVRADLTGARLERLDLMEGSLAKTTLHGADLRGANLFRVDLTHARLDTATRITGAHLQRALMTTGKE